jgi:hypothetical protein
LIRLLGSTANLSAASYLMGSLELTVTHLKKCCMFDKTQIDRKGDSLPLAEMPCIRASIKYAMAVITPDLRLGRVNTMSRCASC